MDVICLQIKIPQITQPRLAIWQKLATSENIGVWTYEKRPRVIRLDLESKTYILDDYDIKPVSPSQTTIQ